MSRILKLQRRLLAEIDKYGKLVPDRSHPTDWERIHMASCAAVGYDLALRRGVDPEMAAIICACHDYGRIVTGRQENHAENGFLPVQDFLRGTGLFTEEEIATIAGAVRNHSKKEEVGTPFEEIVKDADVFDCHRYGDELPRPAQKRRLAGYLREMGYEK